ncbi:MAG: GNAT family N-acetyltransferase [Bacteroidota bacterium]
MLRITEVSTPSQIEQIRVIFQEYAESRGFDDALKGFDEELANLLGKYAAPKGALLLAKWEGKIAGCVALQCLSPTICEMKRMYVKPKFRGNGIGRALVAHLLEMAKERSYKIMRLDTHSSMLAAHQLYAQFGFTEIERYNENPIKGIRFFELLLAE